ncbi:MAG TPA: hypothetical protein V6C72_17675, partial [Chroococcales cyanobacterium]
MGKSQRRSDTGESKALSHNVFHPALKSDVFGASDTQVLSVSQTASLLHLSETRVLDLIESKVLCAKKDLTGKSWLIEKECALAQMTNFVKEQPATANPAQLPLEGVVGETFDAEPAEAEFGHIFSEIAIGDLGAIRASSPIERLEEALELQL